MDTITPQELQQRRASLKLFDIRKAPDDRQIPDSSHADGAALVADDVPFGKDEEVVLYCGSGNSSNRIAKTLQERGYRNSRSRAATRHGSTLVFRRRSSEVQPNAVTEAGD